MAYTGIAATLLPNGRTVHKTFCLAVPMFPDSSSNIKANSNQGRYALEIIDRTLRHIMNIDIPFGGKMMILGGDFRQLLPVLTHATRSEMFLLDVGDGKSNDANDDLLLPDACPVSEANNIIEYLVGNIIRTQRFNELTKSVILSARNIDVDIINEQVVELLNKTTEKINTAIDSTDNCDNGDMTDAILPEYLNTSNPQNFPPHELCLRKNTVVMLIRNLNLSEGLCNGTRLMVLDLSTNVLRCNILTGDKAGEIVFINRVTLYCDNVNPFTFKRRQFPIKIAFCMTINKSQGQTFNRIAVDLSKKVFNHGQLYVALSRVRSWQSLHLYLSSEKVENSVKNFVFKELYS
ncbi:ATP-dependent DNA helicase pif1-like [Microplitis mediator]|uniref:ATP-dependent DNA helicase pif1-like n=1 Tax=Microplitis mediator TaxID=375433 RepID=UPI002554CE49|nr:ATP-dependent DNA helicase pif1-like [Microplitis mediator]